MKESLASTTILGKDHTGGVPTALTLDLLRLQGEAMTLGQRAKIVGRFSPAEQIDIHQEYATAQAVFWKKWTVFRCSQAGEGDPNFGDVQKVLGVNRYFAREIVNPEAGAFIVDLGGGSGTVPASFTKQQREGLAGCAIIDNNDLLAEKAEQRLKRMSIANSRFIDHDLADGSLPEKLSEIISAAKPSHVVVTTNWSLYFLDAPTRTLFRSCLDPKVIGGRPSRLVANCITVGKFDREKLKQGFIKHLPSYLARFPKTTFRAIQALKQMEQFADELTETTILRTAGEFETLMREAGLTIAAVNPTLLWGQSTAITAVK